METTVTRNGQITLTKEIRDELNIKVGTKLIINRIGSLILIKKKDKNFWDTYKGDALVKGYNPKKYRKDYRKRFKNLEIL
ncbi:AbrB/MazE/SpoVT family DNA-binding domain-containing protein [Candidatus Woesearchaeota archaeon]|nr:AbrB/MazE/SpoVT family DNA-binding domain-containing protein [Candidatus Woesearchaeota archaeon]